MPEAWLIEIPPFLLCGVRWNRLDSAALAVRQGFARFSSLLIYFTEVACGNRTRDLLRQRETLCGSTSAAWQACSGSRSRSNPLVRLNNGIELCPSSLVGSILSPSRWGKFGGKECEGCGAATAPRGNLRMNPEITGDHSTLGRVSWGRSSASQQGAKTGARTPAQESQNPARIGKFFLMPTCQAESCLELTTK